MARIQIRLPEEYRKTLQTGHVVPSERYETLVDGHRIDGLTGIIVTWDLNGVPTATLNINVSDLEIDALALANLQLHAAQQTKHQKMAPMTAIRQLRKARKETLEDVAKATGISIGDLSRIETGRLTPYPVHRARLAKYFGVDEKELSGEVTSCL